MKDCSCSSDVEAKPSSDSTIMITLVPAYTERSALVKNSQEVSESGASASEISAPEDCATEKNALRKSALAEIALEYASDALEENVLVVGILDKKKKTLEKDNLENKKKVLQEEVLEKNVGMEGASDQKVIDGKALRKGAVKRSIMVIPNY